MRLLALILLILPLQLVAQDISGIWKGTIYQEPGRNYYYDITIDKGAGDKVSGTTTIKDTVTGNYGKLLFEGTFKDNTLRFQETEILREDKSKVDPFYNHLSFRWCIKSGTLTLSEANGREYLKGPWTGNGTYSPGTINASRDKPKTQKQEPTNGCDELTSADFLLGMWTGDCKQYSCGINQKFEMIVLIDKVDGMEFSGLFIWMEDNQRGDRRSKLTGKIEGGKVIFYEGLEIGGRSLLVGGTYWSTLEDCDHMSGYWNMPYIPDGCTKKVLKDGADYSLEHYNLPTIYFPHGSSELSKKSQSDLIEMAAFAKKLPTLKFDLSGHTDDTGSNAGNVVLSRKRAQIVIDFLVSKGVSAQRFDYSYHAHTKPAVNNDTEERKQLNRRTEIQIRTK